MSCVKEYDSPNGKFYSCWAFDENAHEFATHNHNVLRKFDNRYIMARGSKENVARVCAENPDKMVYVTSGQSYGRQQYRIMQNPENLSVEELALIVDGGNLCFGFRGSPLYIDIYTD